MIKAGIIMLIIGILTSLYECVNKRDKDPIVLTSLLCVISYGSAIVLFFLGIAK